MQNAHADHRDYVLERKDEPDSVVCSDCGNGMLKTSFDADTGGWLVGWIGLVLRLRKLVGVR